MKKHYFSSSERNKHVICNALRQILNPNRDYSAVEVASGYGQHILLFAKEFLQVTWHPTEVNKEYLNT